MGIEFQGFDADFVGGYFALIDFPDNYNKQGRKFLSN